ncbi:MFS transporter [Compostibacter hankyongensis]|uniref:MFS transporter n=1 Tax=Compostibacter hankyongensis TaxID=1007089 RepID=A0ABP8FVC5_9BACT
MRHKSNSVLSIAVIVASLGYFVDIYDLLLFSIIRIKSLTGLGLNEQQVRDVGLQLLNVQMAGLLLGGILWGVLGDKKGRLSVLFGSIFLYSVANVANGLVHGTQGYLIWRFVAGVGLAGELGAGVTLVSELLPKEKRGYGTMLISAFGVIGAVAAGLIGKLFEWRTCYFIGGGLGFVLLLMRIGILESGMYVSVKDKKVSRGNFLVLFSDWKRCWKYLKCILIGLPCWYAIGILVSFSNDFAKALGVKGAIVPGTAVMVFYTALSIGSLLSGYLSQIWKSRRKSLILFLFMTLFFVLIYFFARGITPLMFYLICFGMGVGVGYWAVFVTIAAEQFGTNLRATVAITVPNFVRGVLVLISICFKLLADRFSLLTGGLLTGLICIGIALIAAFTIEETYHKDLDYIEEV